ncbi:MAG TPA: hypothetical protein VFK44_09895 [Bacillales bacterium]|nr:hypothetical protein [Bacillales bacterium]
MLNYWTRPLDIAPPVRLDSATVRLAAVAVFSAIAAMFQAMGGLFPGPGYAFSMLATLPVAVSILLFARTGLLSYPLCFALLFFLQPSELVVFPFTTGLLGVSVGLAFLLFRRRLPIVFFNAAALSAGIAFALYGLRFPVLGPEFPTRVGLAAVTVIVSFSLLYSWAWTEFTAFVWKRIAPALRR